MNRQYSIEEVRHTITLLLQDFQRHGVTVISVRATQAQTGDTDSVLMTYQTTAGRYKEHREIHPHGYNSRLSRFLIRLAQFFDNRHNTRLREKKGDYRGIIREKHVHTHNDSQPPITRNTLTPHDTDTDIDIDMKSETQEDKI